MELSKTPDTLENSLEKCYNITLEVSNMSRPKLEEIDKKIQELQAQKQTILNREKQKERKDRTRRLIEIGAIIEKGLNINSKYMALALVDYLKKYEDNFKKLTDYIEKNESALKEKDIQEKQQKAQNTTESD
jgi:hypothetical protein